MPSNPHYYASRTLTPSAPVGSATIHTNFYANVQTTHPAYGQQQSPGALDNYPHSPYEVSEQAAKNERRRRNTAASARFRQKKKQKEETMESQMTRVQSRNADLEARVNQLQVENKWLKELITEKNGKPASDYGDEHDEHDLSSRGGTVNGTSLNGDREASL